MCDSTNQKLVWLKFRQSQAWKRLLYDKTRNIFKDKLSPPFYSSHFSIFTMDDKPAIVNFLLSNHYIKDNHALDKENELLRQKIAALQHDNRLLTRRVSQRNHRIGILEERLQFNEYHYEQQLRLQRILVSRDGALHVFRRNHDGVFVQVPEDDDSTESEPEVEPRTEEEVQEIARRLGFDTDSDGYISDDLMRSLLEDE